MCKTDGLDAAPFDDMSTQQETKRLKAANSSRIYGILITVSLVLPCTARSFYTFFMVFFFRSAPFQKVAFI